MQISCESAAVSEILPKIKMKLIKYMMDQVFFHFFKLPKSALLQYLVKFWSHFYRYQRFLKVV